MNAIIRHKEIRIRDVVSSEITKIISHPTVIIALAITMFINLGFAIIVATGIFLFYTASSQAPATLSSCGVVMFPRSTLSSCCPLSRQAVNTKTDNSV